MYTKIAKGTTRVSEKCQEQFFALKAGNIDELPGDILLTEFRRFRINYKFNPILVLKTPMK